MSLSKIYAEQKVMQIAQIIFLPSDHS